MNSIHSTICFSIARIGAINSFNLFTSSWSRSAMRRQRSRSTLARVMAWRQQANTCTNVDLTVTFCGIHLNAISQRVPKLKHGLLSIRRLALYKVYNCFFLIKRHQPSEQSSLNPAWCEATYWWLTDNCSPHHRPLNFENSFLFYHTAYGYIANKVLSISLTLG